MKEIEIPKDHKARIEGNKVIIEWKEIESENERMRKQLLAFAELHIYDFKKYKYSRDENIQQIISWWRNIIVYLKRQKEQKPTECINFDNEFKNQVSHLLASVLNKEYDYTKDFVKYASQLLLGYAKNELKPAEWSEEDEYIFNKIISWIVIVNPTSSIFEKLPKEQFIERFKSFRSKIRRIFYALDAPLAYDKDMNPIYPPINHWKPSEEQMKALKNCVNGWPDNADGILESLYHDLKQL